MGSTRASLCYCATTIRTKRIIVQSPSRIHCGLLNETGLFGFIDAGFGFSLDAPCWNLEINVGSTGHRGIPLCTEHQEAVDQALNLLCDRFGHLDMSIIIHSQIPAHIGLGSKTSLLLAVGQSFCELVGLHLDHVELARIMGRGGTSGIGVYSTMEGGYIHDAGHRYPEEKNCFGPSSMQLSTPPRLLFRSHVEWAYVTHFRFADIGINGEREKQLFSAYCPIPENETKTLLRLTDEYVDQAIQSRDENRLQHGISKLQDLGFKKIEWDHQEAITKEFRSYWLGHDSPYALGLSSMGPTLYCISSNPTFVLDLIEDFGLPPMHCEVSPVSNSGLRMTRKG